MLIMNFFGKFKKKKRMTNQKTTNAHIKPQLPTLVTETQLFLQFYQQMVQQVKVYIVKI